MCDHHPRPADPNPEDRPPRRRKLWELECRLHCSVVGTCLSLADLHRIGAKLRLQLKEGVEEYEIHGYFVNAAGQGGRVAKTMHKTLDRLHASPIRRFARLRHENDVLAMWRDALDEGDIPGPYWAVVTHPAASDQLIYRVFGQVHMLSHLVGAANRADIRRLNTLEQERDTLGGALAEARRRVAEREADIRLLLDQHAAEIRALDERLVAARTQRRYVETLEERVSDLESGATVRALTLRLNDLKARLGQETRRADDAGARLIEQGQLLDRLRGDVERLERSLAETNRECAALETLVQNHYGAGNGTPDAAIDLSGWRIVYVGGHQRLIPHLRSLVERANGALIHHDGGVDENSERLGNALSRGDAIFCPVDCVSHSACQVAKRLCKQRSKIFVPLRSSGLSSFVTGLREITASGLGPADGPPT